jgi:amino acid transporter
MSLSDFIFGRPLASWESKKEELTVWTGVPVLGLDALASTGYGPEAALAILTVVGVAGLRYFPVIVILIVVKLATLYFSYRQTAEEYPNGGGAYNVTKDNFGTQVALWAAVALMLDYFLNVAVGISAGIGAVVSAVPSLQPHTLMLCLLVLLTLTLVNLRGVRESGLVFILPVFIFVVCLAIAIGTGLIRTWLTGGHPQPVIPPPPIPPPAASVSGWLLLTAFANGCTAMTGIEAVSNGVPLFRQPTIPNAHKTLTVIMLILSLFLLGLGYLCPAYQIGAMNEQQPGYQTILSQLVAAVAGRNVFYYVSLASIFIVLTYSAQTSFADFPRVCKFLAEDCFLPPAFARLGRRLVFSHGIVVLTLFSGLLLIVFGGITDKLIPLFAVGAFGAFLSSQAGMVKHWLRKRGPRYRTKLFYNALGAVTTAIVLVIIILAKFKEGAWITVIVAPALVLLLRRINQHDRKIAREVGQAIDLHPSEVKAPAVIIPIKRWDRVAERAVRFGLLLSNDITAIHVSTGQDDKGRLKELWREKVEKPAEVLHLAIPRLTIIDSPYRQICEPIIEFVNGIAKEKADRPVAVIIPEVVEPHWYEFLLHNLYGPTLEAELLIKGDERVIVINTPWHLRDT